MTRRSRERQSRQLAAVECLPRAAYWSLVRSALTISSDGSEQGHKNKAQHELPAHGFDDVGNSGLGILLQREDRGGVLPSLPRWLPGKISIPPCFSSDWRPSAPVQL